MSAPPSVTSACPRAAVAIGGPGDIADFSAYDHTICGSPVISTLSVHQVLVVGESDGVMPAKSRDAYVAAVRAAGDPIELILVPNAGHFEVIALTAPAFAAVRQATLKAIGVN